VKWDKKKFEKWEQVKLEALLIYLNLSLRKEMGLYVQILIIILGYLLQVLVLMDLVRQFYPRPVSS